MFISAKQHSLQKYKSVLTSRYATAQEKQYAAYQAFNACEHPEEYQEIEELVNQIEVEQENNTDIDELVVVNKPEIKHLSRHERMALLTILTSVSEMPVMSNPDLGTELATRVSTLCPAMSADATRNVIAALVDSVGVRDGKA